jgi:hypothetical protein
MTIFFMHIPKTAGTSFRFFLRRATEAQEGICLPEINDSYLDYDTFLQESAAISETYDLIYGHFPYHVSKMLPPANTVVTVLRDPLERCISHIKHQIQVSQESEDQGTTITDINAFIASQDPQNRIFLQTLRNLTVKYLSRCGDPNEVYSDADLSLLKAAKNCQKILFGFADELEDFQKKLADELFPEVIVESIALRENTSSDSFSVNDLTARNRAFLEDLNLLDLHLYERLKYGKKYVA